MATRNRLAKIPLFADPHINLLGSVIVSHHKDTIIVERPAPKPRAKGAAPRKPRAPKVNAKPPAQPATAFPPAEAARG